MMFGTSETIDACQAGYQRQAGSASITRVQMTVSQVVKHSH